jgi:hypothetical protein
MIAYRDLLRLLRALGDLLESRGLDYSIVAVGGGGLLLQGLSARTTVDLDIVALVEHGAYVKADRLPTALLEAARQIGVAAGVQEDWLNSVAADVMNPPGLPPGFADRARVLRYGGLTLHVASRFDLICLKVHAAVDRAPASKHLDDLRLLEPTTDELVQAGQWAMGHDPSLGFRSQLVALLKMFGVDNADQLL